MITMIWKKCWLVCSKLLSWGFLRIQIFTALQCLKRVNSSFCQLICMIQLTTRTIGWVSIYDQKLICVVSHLSSQSSTISQVLCIFWNIWTGCFFFSSVGICMLLSVLEEQAMDSLLLGPDKQNDFMQSILHTMEKEAAGN